MDETDGFSNAEKVLTLASGIGLFIELKCMKQVVFSIKYFSLIILLFEAKFTHNLPLRTWNGAKIGFFSSILLYLVAKWNRQNRQVHLTPC